MKIKRVVASIGASFDQFITKMENHDAVAKCVIDDVRQSAAKIRGEKQRVERRLASVDSEINALEKNKRLWKERAMSCLDVDEEKAKACMQQFSSAEKQLSDVHIQREKLSNIANKLVLHLKDIEHKIDDLESRRMILSSRQAKANVVSRLDEQHTLSGGEALFDRWEEHILHSEYSDGEVLAEDVSASSLTREFEEQEENERLGKMLNALRKEKDARAEQNSAGEVLRD